MVWPLARLERVRMIWVKAEIMPAVLQGEAKAFRHNPCAKAPVIAVDERTRISKFIYNTQIDRS